MNTATVDLNTHTLTGFVGGDHYHKHNMVLRFFARHAGQNIYKRSCTGRECGRVETYVSK